MEFPFVSVIIVNYNGRLYLPACLDALHTQSYPHDCFEVIVSDNGSSDSSLELLARHYPWVHVLENKQNLGFARGNNVAIKAARGEYLVLLNNDTAPRSDWLENLVKLTQSDPQIGLVTSHLQMFYNQVELRLQTETCIPSGETRSLGVQVYEVDGGSLHGVVQYLAGFYPWEVGPCGRFRWMKDDSRLGIPLPEGSDPWEITLRLAAQRPAGQGIQVQVYHQDTRLAEWEVTSQEPQKYQLVIPPGVRSTATPLEQNTGSIVFSSGAGRDRGTYVRDSEVFFEEDHGQYSQSEEVFAGCGAGLLIKREMLDDVGDLDDSFFMYYEDTDLSWRAHLRGWKVVYAPHAYIRHIHCGTTKEWSPFFLYLTERNRLAMVFKNGAPRQVLRVWGGYILKVLSLVGEFMQRMARRRSGLRQLARQLSIHLRVLGSLFLWQPALWLKRYRIQRMAKIPPKNLEPWFIQ